MTRYLSLALAGAPESGDTKPTFLASASAIAVLTALVAAAPSTAWAQAADTPATVAEDAIEDEVVEDAEGRLDTVVVTATRREEGVQDLGISVSAFSGAELKARNITITQDIANQTPGLSLIQAGGAPLSGLIAIRGVAQNDFAAHLESSNTVYVDNTYRHSNAGNLSNLFDVQRVEVLRGPQGTLFGRNATGGLVHILSNEVSDELGGYADLTVGSFNQVRAEAALNVPLSDAIAFRISGFANQNDGYIENDIGPDQIPDDSKAFRGQVLLTPNDQLTARFQVEYRETELDQAGGGFPTGGFAGADGLGQFREPPNNFTDTGFIDADGSVFTGSFNEDGFFDRTETNVFLDLQYDFGGVTLTSISSYNDIDSAYEEDNDLTPFDITIFRQNSQQESFTQEVRLAGGTDVLDWTVGAYYLNIDGDYFQNFQINNVGNFNQILAPIDVLLLPVGQNLSANYSLETDSWSVFGEGKYSFTDQISVTAGLRFTEDSKDYSYLASCEFVLEAPIPDPCFPAPPPTILAGAGLVEDSSSENGVSARLQLDYKATDDVLLYASYNRGYKAFNYNAGFAGAALVEDVRFDGETLNAYEVGTKIEFNNIIRLNAAGFYYDYNDYQAFDQVGTSFILSNTDAEIFGADAELTFSPGNGFNGNIGISWVETEIPDFVVAGVPRDVEAPQAPNFTFNFAASQDLDVDLGTFRLGVDGVYTGDYFSQLNNAPVTEAGDHWLVNARLSFQPHDADWQTALFVRNLFDEERLLYAFDITFPGNGLVEQVFGPPRWAGAEIRVNF